MANSLDQNPIIVTTPMPQPYKAAVASSQGSPLTLRVEKIRWVDAVNANDELKIVDPVSGAVLLDLINPVANSSVEIDWVAHPKLWQDFQVSVIGSGTLYLYTL